MKLPERCERATSNDLRLLVHLRINFEGTFVNVDTGHAVCVKLVTIHAGAHETARSIVAKLGARVQTQQALVDIHTFCPVDVISSLA